MTSISLDERLSRRGSALTAPFFAVLVLFAAVALHWLLRDRAFLVSEAYRASLPIVGGGLLVLGLGLWWLVFSAAHRDATPRRDLPVQIDRGNTWALQPLAAAPLLFAGAALASAYTIPQLGQLALSEPTIDMFVVENAPGDGDDCRPTRSFNPEYGTVTLCLPLDIAARLPATPAGDTLVYAPGRTSWFGFSPTAFELEAPQEEPAATVVPGAALPVADQQPSFEVPQSPEIPDITFNVNDILRQHGIEPPAPSAEPDARAPDAPGFDEMLRQFGVVPPDAGGRREETSPSIDQRARDKADRAGV